MRHFPRCALALFSLVFPVPIQAEDASGLFDRAVFAEDTSGDLDKAIRLYGEILRDHKKQSRLAAQASLRLGHCYRKRGDRARALGQFQEVTKQFPKEEKIVAQARRAIANLNARSELLYEEKELEVTLHTLESGEPCGLDIETGRLYAVKERDFKSRTDLDAWAARYGIDALVLRGRFASGLLGINAATGSLETNGKLHPGRARHMLRTKTNRMVGLGRLDGVEQILAIRTADNTMAIVRSKLSGKERALTAHVTYQVIRLAGTLNSDRTKQITRFLAEDLQKLTTALRQNRVSDLAREYAKTLTTVRRLASWTRLGSSAEPFRLAAEKLASFEKDIEKLPHARRTELRNALAALDPLLERLVKDSQPKVSPADLLPGLKAEMAIAYRAVREKDFDRASASLKRMTDGIEQFKRAAKGTPIEGLTGSGLKILDELKKAVDAKDDKRASELLKRLDNIGPAIESLLGVGKRTTKRAK